MRLTRARRVRIAAGLRFVFVGAVNGVGQLQATNCQDGVPDGGVVGGAVWARGDLDAVHRRQRERPWTDSQRQRRVSSSSTDALAAQEL